MYGNSLSRAGAKKVLAELPVISHPTFASEENRNIGHKRLSIWAAIRHATEVSGDFAEFGVFKGRCARQIEKLLPPDTLLHLFDSFEGLPTDWGAWKKGHFALAQDEIPTFSERCRVYKGWFKDTLPDFVSKQQRPLAFIHADADLYQATIEVLEHCDKLIVPGTIILFDEYAMKDKTGIFKDDEHRALVDWANRCDRSFVYLWRTSHIQVAIRVVK